jgi:hypothetical protein
MPGTPSPPPLTTVNAEGPAAAAAALATLAAAPPASLSTLTSLRFAFCDVEGADIEAALSGSGRGLRSLSLEGTHKVTDAAAARLVARLGGPSLEALSLYWGLTVHDAVLTAGALCPGLTRLNLSGCKSVTDAALAAVAGGCPALASLDVTRCPALTDGGVAAAVGGCGGGAPPLARLTELRCYACEAVGDATLTALGAACPALEVLDCCGATGATDAGVAALAAGCPRLREVGLGWVAGVGDGGVTALADCCRSLTSLSLHGNRLVTTASLWALAGLGGGGGGEEQAKVSAPSRSVRPPLPLTALDVMGCVGIPAHLRKKEGLVGLFVGLKVLQLQR